MGTDTDIIAGGEPTGAEPAGGTATGGVLDALADEMLEAILDALPQVATLLGFTGPRDRLLPDYRFEAEQAVQQRFADIAARAAAFDPAQLSPADRATRAVILQQAEDVATRTESRLVEFTICDTFSSAAGDLLFSLPMITLGSAEQAEAYLDRLAAVPAALDTLAQRHRAAVADGLLPVRDLVEAAAAHVDRYLANEVDPLTRPTPGPDSGVDVDSYAERRARILAESVRPAFAAYRDVLLTEIAPHSRDIDHPGLCHLPGGTEIYNRLIALHTTTDRNADELHQTGLDVIEKLAGEYREIAGRAFGLTELPEIFERLRTDPALRWRDGDELLDAARAAITRAEAVAPDWFGVLPEQRCEVQAVPADEAPGAAGAYYLPAALDGSRPGIYFANTSDAQDRDKAPCESIAFHEAVPGHHFQISVAQGLTGLPMLRRLVPFTAYGEGWGLYAERLAVEMGLYSDDIALLGMLSADSLRAARLVVDTGMHAKGWSREQAVRYMQEHTPVMQVEIESEIDRYIADPGQALAYMVGRLEILRIRADAQQRLGADFDIRAFHDTVLSGGSLPLSTLEENVTGWADTVAAQSGARPTS